MIRPILLGLGAILVLNQLWKIEQRVREERANANIFSSTVNYISGVFDGSYRRERVRKENNELRGTVNVFAGVVNELVGVFRQVVANTGGEPIYKHVSGGTWGMKKIGHYNGEALFVRTWLGSFYQFVGRALTYIAIAVDAFTVLNAASMDFDQGTATYTVCAGSNAVGGYYGAVYGASLGATLLSIIPFIGTFVGAIVGGNIGVTVGAAFGNFAAAVATASPHC